MSNIVGKFDLEMMPKIFQGMSAFAFMAFAMAVVNAALSTANNVNDNNNNNNNNNNDNNNNLANINVANANNAANNENMAMAGRRRRLQRLESNLSNFEVESRPELFATRVMLQDDQLVYAPLKIGYDDQGQEEASELSSEPRLPSNLSPPISANVSHFPSSTLTNSKSIPRPSSSYLDRLLASANSLLGQRRKKRNAFESRLQDFDHIDFQESSLENFDHFESSLEDFDQLEGELAQIALTFIGQTPSSLVQC